MSHPTEMRVTYLGAFPHTVVAAVIWLASGILGQFTSTTGTILFFLVAGFFIFPLGEVIRKAMNIPNRLSEDNRLPMLFMWLAFTLPLSYPLIYLACRHEIRVFFSAFTILVGAHYLPFIYGYKMPSFGMLAITLVGIGTYFGLLHPEQFAIPALITGSVLLVFAFVHLFLLKRYYHER